MKLGFLSLGLSLLLAGCMTDREMPVLKTKFVALDAAQGLVTSEITSDCAARLSKEFPRMTIVGAFFLSAKAARMVGDRDIRDTFNQPNPNDDIVALIAPTSNKGLFGHEFNAFLGCSYHLQNSRLVFRATHGPNFLPRRVG